MAATDFPPNYVNTAVERALDDLAAAPGEDTLFALLDAALRGGLVLDVTGSTPQTGPRVRTVPSIDGHAVLPLFTSMARLETAVGEALAEQASGGRAGADGSQPHEAPVQGAIVPGRRALEVIRAGDFVAVQFNPGPAAQVIARAHVEVALDRGTDI